MHHPTLRRLSDTGLTVANPAEDVRRAVVKDRAGNEIGVVEDLLVDDEERRVRFLRVEHGGILGFGATPVFVPTDVVVSVSPKEVRIDREAEEIAGAPRYDPQLADEEDFYAGVYGYFGIMPYWTAGPQPPATERNREPREEG